MVDGHREGNFRGQEILMIGGDGDDLRGQEIAWAPIALSPWVCRWPSHRDPWGAPWPRLVGVGGAFMGRVVFGW